MPPIPNDKTKKGETMNDNVVRVKVTGEYACFTRPDLKVERMTYPCMTPSAARGVLDCILWKPEFVWHIHRIIVLNPIKFASVKRNEINKKQGKTPMIIEVDRTQRNSIILKDVAYIIEASVHNASSPVKNPTKKYVEMFNRRVSKGQCWRRPYLGTREFAAEFCLPASDDLEKKLYKIFLSAACSLICCTMIRVFQRRCSFMTLQ